MKIRGVNLGNWLSLEKWMKPELFDGIDAEDELDFFSMLPKEEAFSRLRKHYETYITEEDFAFMANAGVNLLRIPIPYYIYGEEDRPASIDILDKAFDWAEKYGMQILVDLHSARGGQNAFDNSGACGLCTWHKHPDYVEETLLLLETLARHYAGRKAFWGLCPLNEPAAPHIMALNTMIYGDRYPERIAISEAVPDDFLKQFYMDVYTRVKPLMPRDAVLVLSDQFDLSRWEDFMPRDEYSGVWLDAHKYLTFSEGMLEGEGGSSYGDAAGNGRRGLVMENYEKLIREIFLPDILKAAKKHPVLVGEWSMVQNMLDIKNAPDAATERALYCRLAQAHLDAWEQVEGSCYWSYRVTDTRPAAWNFRTCVENGWLSYR